MLGSWVRIPAGSLFKTRKRSKLLKFNKFREFLFSGNTSKTADSGDQSGNTHFSGHGRSVPESQNKRNLPTSSWKVSFIRASCRIRTNDPEITNHVLWPAELKRHHFVKTGKLTMSHRYNHIPLLPSDPGGVLQELVA